MQYVQQLNAALEGTLAPNTETIKQVSRTVSAGWTGTSMLTAFPPHPIDHIYMSAKLVYDGHLRLSNHVVNAFSTAALDWLVLLLRPLKL